MSTVIPDKISSHDYARAVAVAFYHTVKETNAPESRTHEVLNMTLSELERYISGDEDIHNCFNSSRILEAILYLHLNWTKSELCAAYDRSAYRRRKNFEPNADEQKVIDKYADEANTALKEAYDKYGKKRFLAVRGIVSYNAHGQKEFLLYNAWGQAKHVTEDEFNESMAAVQKLSQSETW